MTDDTRAIEPALTADEWRELNINGMHAGSTDGEPLIFTTCEDCAYPPPKVMALANAALPDGDRRKITRDDVGLLAMLVRRFTNAHDPVAGEIQPLADKLAALLPSEP